MEQDFCQSCGMPLTADLLGTNADGSRNMDYCIFCYKDGRFLQDVTMEGMIDHCLKYLDEMNQMMPTPMTADEYRKILADLTKTYQVIDRGGHNFWLLFAKAI